MSAVILRIKDGSSKMDWLDIRLDHYGGPREQLFLKMARAMQAGLRSNGFEVQLLTENTTIERVS